MSTPRTLVVGIGSPHGDDQAGWLVADELAAGFNQDDVAVRKAATPVEMIHWLNDIDRLIVCDACRGLGRVGEVRSWTWPACELSDMVWSGTHDFSLPAVFQLADRLDRLPQRVVIWSVEGKYSNALSTVSSEVVIALPRLINEITNEINLDEQCTNKHL